MPRRRPRSSAESSPIGVEKTKPNWRLSPVTPNRIRPISAMKASRSRLMGQRFPRRLGGKCSSCVALHILRISMWQPTPPPSPLGRRLRGSTTVASQINARPLPHSISLWSFPARSNYAAQLINRLDARPLEGAKDEVDDRCVPGLTTYAQGARHAV